ncbi:tail fiber domain-containing protein [Methylobacterium sp.]|uniref:tail fiber domain-containing protein n=1 Tax=Methylobacterium sp. TaxID=409 RepID=UPI003B010013
MARLGLGENITNDISGVQNTNNQNRLAGAGLAQSQAAQQAGVLGQLLAGGQFNSNLGLQQAQGALSTYGQGASNNLAGASTDASNDLNTQQFNANLGLQRANGTISAGQQGLSTALQSAGLLPSVDALRYAPASNLLQVGGMQQQQNQAGLDAAQQRFQETQQVPWQALGQYASYPLAIGSQGGTTVSQGTSQTKTSGVSPLQSILGLGTSLLGLGSGTIGGQLFGGMFGSDERMKTDVREVGELHDGQKVYAYRYGDEPRTQIGLLAQEVADRKPGAVGPIGLGDLLGVDYAKATEDAAKKGGGGSSAPAAPPAGGPEPRLTMVIRGGLGPHGTETATGLGQAIMAALDSASARSDGAPAGLLAHAMQAMIPQEPEPIRRERPKAKTGGKRRAAA